MNKTWVILFVLLCLTGLQGENITVDQYVLAIERLQNETLTWKIPTSFKNYFDNSAYNAAYEVEGTYDFIIIGSGSSGSVLGRRLTEVPHWTVLILEAGEPEDITADIPAMDRNLWLSKYNWGYLSEPQKNVMQGYVNNRITIPRGKAVGGSSVINSLIYARGNPQDYDLWGKGNPGWAYKDVLPYFIKSENATMPDVSLEYHGKNGLWNVEYSRIFDQIGKAFLDASEERGRPILDYNGQSQMGSSVLQVNEKNGVRTSVAKAFLRPVEKRSNLKILTKAFATKILIDPITKEAYGACFVRNGTKYCARAKKEVIVSAGTINTPHLLMLSGIGPKEELEKFNISSIKHLPVGKNMWDHTIVTFQYFMSNYTYPPLPKTAAEVKESIRENVIQYLKGQGPYTSAGSEQAIGYISPYSKNTKVPDIELVLHGGRDTVDQYGVYFKRNHLTKDTYESIAKPTQNVSAFHIHSILLHPESRGTIKLKSSCPFDFPLIDPQYFSNPQDASVFLAAVKEVLNLVQTKAFQKYDAQVLKRVHPLCQNNTYGSDVFWLCMIKNLATTTHHFAGTSKMGPRWNNDSVVDNQLKVHGVHKLRVIDASVIPVSISGHTGAVTVMIAEKGADIIKKEWQRNKRFG